MSDGRDLAWAISHSDKIVESYKDTVPNCDTAQEHRQLAGWLRELRQLRARVKEPKWQPIQTAPMDGTEVLLAEFHGDGYEGSIIDAGHWGFLERSDWDDMPVYAWLSNYGHIEEPTHWMPLPERAFELEVS